MSFFLTGLEGTIVSTSLVAITDDLRGFGRSSWIITSYLLTYAGKDLIPQDCLSYFLHLPTRTQAFS